MPQFDTFDEWQAAVDKRTAQAWQAAEAALEFDPWHRDLGVGHVLHDEGELHEARMDTFQRIMDFIWAHGANPIHALQRLFVLTRCGSPRHLALMNQSDVAVLLNETRAATSARELKLWQQYLIERGFFGGTKRPLMKSGAAKQAYAETAAGNRNRKGGKRAIRKYSVLREEHAKAQAKNKRKPSAN